MADRMPTHDQELQQARDDLATQVAVSEQQRGASLADRAQLRHTLEYSGIATWKLFLPEGRFEWSENAHVLHGLAPDAAIDRLEDWLERVHPDDRPALATLTEEAASSLSADQHEEWEYRIIGADGFVRWFSGRGEVEPRGAANWW